MENISTDGYKILDLSAYGPFNPGIAVTVPGIADFVKSNMTKPILVTGAVVESADVPAFFANLKFDITKDAYVGYYGNKIMTIYPDDRFIFGA